MCLNVEQMFKGDGMSTCVRAGVTYHRHRWNNDGLCSKCGTESLYALNRRFEHEQLALATIPIAQQDEAQVAQMVSEGGSIAPAHSN